jgi:ribosomal protein L3
MSLTPHQRTVLNYISEFQNKRGYSPSLADLAVAFGGAGRDGGRVAKGKRMAGRMGSDRVTNKNLTVVKVSPKTGEIFIRGAVAGRKGSLVEIRA